MIELIEVPIYSPDNGEEYYRKSLVILLSNFTEDHITLSLKSRGLYRCPVSKKRWGLIKKFKREGCILKRSAMVIIPNRKYRHRFWLSLEEVIKLGHIYDSNIVWELKKIDKNKKS